MAMADPAASAAPRRRLAVPRRERKMSGDAGLAAAERPIGTENPHLVVPKLAAKIPEA